MRRALLAQAVFRAGGSTYQPVSHHIVDVWTRVDFPLENEPRAGDIFSRPIRFNVSTMNDEEVGRMSVSNNVFESTAICRQIAALSRGLKQRKKHNPCQASASTYKRSWKAPYVGSKTRF